MSAPLAALLPAAMVGVDRLPPGRPALAGEVGALLDTLADDAGQDAAARLLRAAGVLAVCGRAAAEGEPAPEVADAPAAPETRPVLADAAQLAALGWVLREGPARLQHEALQALSDAGWRLPAAWLPLALEAGRRSIAMRAPLLAGALGERGRWLAVQHTGWAWAAGVAETADGETRWAEGSLEQRVQLLHRQREADPAAARERLATALAELPARERAELAAALATGLSPADEAFLDELRRDRSREVRQAALALLLRLDGTAHGARAAARIAALMRSERVLLKQRWVIDAPESAADDWKAEDVEATRPKHESLGERAWWLYQLVRQVPLAWWSLHTGLEPAGLIGWALQGDWAESLLRGWRDVLLAAPDEGWSEALLEQWPAKLLRDEPSAVLALLPLPRRERFWQRQLEQDASLASVAELSMRLVAACPPGEGLSATFSQRMAAALAQVLPTLSGTLNADYTLRHALPDLAGVLHAQSLPALRAGLATALADAELPQSLANVFHFVSQAVAARETLATLPRAPRSTTS